MPARKAAVVVLSGGQDSTTCLFWARSRYDELHAITFDYGQKHRIELEAAKRVGEMAGVTSHLVVTMPGILQSTSPLINHSRELETYSDFRTMDQIIGDRVELTFVPMRNLLFFTIAANLAVCVGAEAIITGICQADNANYPDCRDSFRAAAQMAINTALGADQDQTRLIRLIAPLMNCTKPETVHMAASMPGCLEAMAFSHTCYAGQFPPCGKCHACVLRAHGFEEAGVTDPLVARGMTA